MVLTGQKKVFVPLMPRLRRPLPLSPLPLGGPPRGWMCYRYIAAIPLTAAACCCLLCQCQAVRCAVSAQLKELHTHSSILYIIHTIVACIFHLIMEIICCCCTLSLLQHTQRTRTRVNRTYVYAHAPLDTDYVNVHVRTTQTQTVHREHNQRKSTHIYPHHTPHSATHRRRARQQPAQAAGRQVNLKAGLD